MKKLHLLKKPFTKVWVKKLLIFSHHTVNQISRKNKEPVTTCPFRGLLVWNSGNRFATQQMEDLIRNKQSVKQMLQRRRLILNDHLPKFATENSVWSNFTLMELMANKIEIVFHIILQNVLYQGSQLLQILLKALK